MAADRFVVQINEAPVGEPCSSQAVAVEAAEALVEPGDTAQVLRVASDETMDTGVIVWSHTGGSSIDADRTPTVFRPSTDYQAGA